MQLYLHLQTPTPSFFFRIISTLFREAFDLYKHQPHFNQNFITPLHKPDCENNGKPKKNEKSHKKIFLHLPFNPSNPPSTVIHQLYNSAFNLNDNTQHDNILSKAYTPFTPRTLTIAYHHQPSLANILVPSDFRKTNCPPASTFRDNKIPNTTTLRP